MEIRCERCKRMTPTGISAKLSKVTFGSGNIIQCRHCGHINNMPPSQVETDEEGHVIKATLLNSGIPRADLLKFFNLVQDYLHDNNTDKQSFSEAAVSINPSLDRFLKLIVPKTPAEFIAWLSLIVAILMPFLTPKPTTQETIIYNNNTTINPSYSDSLEIAFRQRRLDNLHKKKQPLQSKRKR